MRKNFLEKYDIITKTEKIIEYGILNTDGIEELYLNFKGELQRDVTETVLDDSITYYAVANKKDYFPLIEWVLKGSLMNQIKKVSDETE